ncbi:MAG: methionine--tRNA ligase [bacterium]|nr:methionine--tRNA ligase [bacterium]
MKPIIPFEDFSKLDIRVGKVMTCERKDGSEKLLRLTVDFGEEGTRNILSGIAQWYTPEQLVDKQFIFILNLQPRQIMGEMSEGMILAAEGKKPLPLKPLKNAFPGATIR